MKKNVSFLHQLFHTNIFYLFMKNYLKTPNNIYADFLLYNKFIIHTTFFKKDFVCFIGSNVNNFYIKKKIISKYLKLYLYGNIILILIIIHL